MAINIVKRENWVRKINFANTTLNICFTNITDDNARNYTKYLISQLLRPTLPYLPNSKVVGGNGGEPDANYNGGNPDVFIPLALAGLFINKTWALVVVIVVLLMFLIVYSKCGTGKRSPHSYKPHGRRKYNPRQIMYHRAC